MRRAGSWSARTRSPGALDEPTGPAVAPASRAGLIYLALYTGYVVLGMAGRWSGWQNGDQVWFVDAARHILDGSWRIYEFRPAFALGAAPPDGVVYSYSPLLALVLAPFVGLADLLQGSALANSVGGNDQLAYRLIALPLLVTDVLAMEQFRRLVRAWRPVADEGVLALDVVILLGLGSFLQVSASRNHHEGLVFLLLLLTLRATPANPLLGGVWAGLALAAKQTTGLELLPPGLVLLGLGLARRRPTAVLRWTGAALTVFGLFLAPAVLADPAGARYALLTLPQRLVLSGAGLPVWIDAVLSATLGAGAAAYRLWHSRLVDDSNAVLLAVTAIAVCGPLLRAARRGRPVQLRDNRLLALVACTSLLSLVLGKWTGSHYYTLPLALVLLWDTARRPAGLPLVGLAGILGFRAITFVTPLPLIPLPRGIYILALCAGLTVVTLRGALRDEPPAVRTPPAERGCARPAPSARGSPALPSGRGSSAGRPRPRRPGRRGRRPCGAGPASGAPRQCRRRRPRPSPQPGSPGLRAAACARIHRSRAYQP